MSCKNMHVHVWEKRRHTFLAFYTHPHTETKKNNELCTHTHTRTHHSRSLSHQRNENMAERHSTQ